MDSRYAKYGLKYRAAWRQRLELGDPIECSGCGITQPVDQYSPSTIRRCRACNTARAKRYRDGLTQDKRNALYRMHRERVNGWKRANQKRIRVQQYGLTVSEFDSMPKVCQICGSHEGERIHIDHCHDTGRFRGLLCKNCNCGLGMFNDNTELLALALRYLNSNSE
jgi:Recombination endonuclease VII